MTNIKICNKCVMDETVPDIWFNHDGTCNLCIAAMEKINAEVFKGHEGQLKLDSLVRQIKSSTNKKYNCIIGVSGGVDSSYVAYLTKDLGLKPLAIHLDNGWNTDTSVKNIKKILDKLNIDLYTHVIDWEEFRELQLSFLKASIANAEIPTDQAITAILYKMASKFGIKYIINGGNVNSESIMPDSWMEDNLDTRLIKSIHKKYSKKSLKTYPMMGYIKLAYYILVKKIKYVGVLNFVDYDKEAAIKFLENEFNWTPYKEKHFESIFTRWFQSFYLIHKFNIDKRKAHFSSLIISGYMERESALFELKNDYLDQDSLTQDAEFIKEKFQLNHNEYISLVSSDRQSINNFKSYQPLLKRFKRFRGLLKSIATERHK